MTCGDFWLYLFISVAGAFLGVLGAYGIYRSQLKKDRKKENRIKENQERELLKYFHTLLTQIVATIEKKKELFKDYIQKQKESFVEIIPLQSVSSNDFDRAKNLNDSALFNAWMNRIDAQDKLKAYLTLQAELDYMESAIKNMDSIYDSNVAKGFPILVEVNRILQGFCLDLNSFITNNKTPKGEELRLLLAEHLEKSYMNRETPENYTLNNVRGSFLGPVMDIMGSDIANFPRELSDMLGQMIRMFREVEMETRHVLGQFEDTCQEIDRHLDATRGIITYLEPFN